MPHLVYPLLGCEGTTDRRFLLPIILRTFRQIEAECADLELQVYEQDESDVELLSGTGRTLHQFVQDAAVKGAYAGSRAVLCIHADADAADDQVRRNQLKAAFAEVVQQTATESADAFTAVVGSDPPVCHRLVALVPVYKTEAWLLADKDLLRAVLNTKLTVAELGLDYPPEARSSVKADVAEALRRAHQHAGGRPMKQSELYAALGPRLSLDKLAVLDSYQKFQEAVRAAFRQLGYLR
ncbi:MAG: DUF4276 family protein [Hymenobacteraceae bacterium]|nr:DUF4276 family protein [Hymenobacteraceae bacterium]